jgi:hypothetical protein
MAWGHLAALREADRIHEARFNRMRNPMKVKLMNSVGGTDRTLTIEGANADDPPRVIISGNKAYLLVLKGDADGNMVYSPVSAVTLDA